MAPYIPLLTTLAWILFVVCLLIVFRKQLAGLVTALVERVKGGAEFEVAGVKFGRLISKTSDLPPQDVKVFGDPDQIQLLFKAQGAGWVKSTKAMQTATGCLVQVSTERQNPNGSWSSAEALAFVPDVAVAAVDGGNGNRLVPKE